MRNMKSSGIAWVGQIPASWNIKRGKTIMSILTRPVMADDGVITCFRDGEVTLRSNRREEGYTVSMQESGYQGIEPGDLIVHGMDGFAGSIGISDSRGKASPVLNVLDSNENKRFLMFYMRSAAYCGLFLSLATGIRIRTCDTNWNKLKDVLFVIPSISEQYSIVSYIDYQCALIDNSINKTKASIEEYKKLKQAIITQAVTKGVRGDRLMKDSGNEWIVEVPDDWKICKIKYLHNGLTDGTHGTYQRYESGRVLLSSKNVRENTLEIGNNESFISEEDYQSIVANGFPKKNDLLLCCIGASIGRCILYPYDEPHAFQRSVVFIRCNNTILPEYLRLCLLSTYVSVQERILINQSAQAGLYQGLVSDIFVTVPSLDEQKEIVAFLNNKCSDIDNIISSKEKIINELEAYKKSMIYEYVTGKKEVRI